MCSSLLFIGVPALLTTLFHSSKVWVKILRLWLTLGSVFIIFMEIATPAFIETYDYRPNRLFYRIPDLSERSFFNAC